jgi:hypothetical protein
MWNPARLFVGLLIACPLAAMAADTPEAQLLAAEDARYQAVLTHDASALDRMLASDLVYSHMTGKREGKAEVLQASMRMSFRSIQPVDRTVRVIGPVGIIRGKLLRQLPDRMLTDGYLAVYAQRDGLWQLVEWVTANVPSEQQPEK